MELLLFFPASFNGGITYLCQAPPFFVFGSYMVVCLITFKGGFYFSCCMMNKLPGNFKESGFV
jgi:hypothetical protein